MKIATTTPDNKGEDFSKVKSFYRSSVGSDKGRFNLDGDPSQIDGKRPLFNVHSIPASGHPEGATMA